MEDKEKKVEELNKVTNEEKEVKENETNKIDVKKEEKKEDKKVEKKETKEEKMETNKNVNKVETKKEEAKKETPKTKEVKKFETKKDDKKNSKNNYLVIGIVLVIIAVVIITALMLVPGTPKKAVDGMLGCLKSGEFEKAEEFVNYQDLINSSELVGGEESNQDEEKLLFNKMDWKVKKVVENGDIATVEVEITNKDFKTILSNYIQKVAKAAISKQSISEEQYEQYLVDELKNESIQTITVEGEIQVEKQDGKWKVKTDENLIKIILPGLEEALSSLSINQ